MQVYNKTHCTGFLNTGPALEIAQHSGDPLVHSTGVREVPLAVPIHPGYTDL